MLRLFLPILLALPAYAEQMSLGDGFSNAGSSVQSFLKRPSRGRRLLRELHERLRDQVLDSIESGTRNLSYSNARKLLFSAIEKTEQDGVRGIVDAYSRVFIAGHGKDGYFFHENGNQNGDDCPENDQMNTEHIWPRGFFESNDGNLREKLMASDLHNLLPSLSCINNRRASLPFGNVYGEMEYSNNAGAKLGNGVFEPPDAVKGRVARALFYFYTTYYDQEIMGDRDYWETRARDYLKWRGKLDPLQRAHKNRIKQRMRKDFPNDFWNSQLPTLLDWNRRYPPGPEEKLRNDLIERHQGVRNPFIDEPVLADRIGLDGFRFP